MYELGTPYLLGFGHGMKNADHALRIELQRRLANGLDVQASILASVENPVASPIIKDYSKLLVDAPTKSLELLDSVAGAPRSFDAFRTDFVERTERNKKLGTNGELVVVDYERWWLQEHDRSDLAERVEHVSTTRGDGLGYDILSFDSQTGNERYIEVKTTKYGNSTPFILSENELAFSKLKSENFYLARVFDFVASPKVFVLGGAIDENFTLLPYSHIALR